jgi:ribosomal RNA-processing protein 1
MWHADKTLYQREVGLKMSQIMNLLPDDGTDTPQKMKWFNAFIYIFSKWWNKIDNFRLDKYLLFLRFMINECFKWMKAQKYDQNLTSWFCKSIDDILKAGDTVNASAGVSLQICDVIVVELGKIAADTISMDQIAIFLAPFLSMLSTSASFVLR